MSTLHIVGFGIRPKDNLKHRLSWYPHFPDKLLEIESGDAVILNLNDVNDAKTIEIVKSIVNYIEKNGGILVVVSAPVRWFSNSISNYHFLPWSDHSIKQIRNQSVSEIRDPSTAPSWVSDFLRLYSDILISPVCFKSKPNTAQVIMESYQCGCVSLNYQRIHGRILIIPPTKPILHGQSDNSSRQILANYLHRIIDNILVRFWSPSDFRPNWLDSILIGDEEKLREQHRLLEEKMKEINDEKSILADDGHSLTQKVTLIFESLGFHAEDKEKKGKQDIDIIDGDFKAKVECTGGKAYFKIGKLRQLIDYLLSPEGSKGIFVGNPWKDIHPKDRDLSKAFTDNVVKRAEELGICLVTVPHLYRVYLENQPESKRRAVRKSLKKCKGLWQYPTSDW